MTTAAKTKQVQLWWILAFKSQRYRVSQTKSYCSTMSMHNISPIHKFTVKVQKILGSHEVKDHSTVDQSHPKIIEATFNFPELVQACKKISLFHLFILEIQSNLKSLDQTPHTHFLTMPFQKIFDQLLIFMNLHQHAKDQFISSISSRDIVNLKFLQFD